MKPKPPPDRRRFSGERDQMDYLYHKLLYWLYEREDRIRARTFAQRLAQLLSKSAAARRDFPGGMLVLDLRGQRRFAQGDQAPGE